MDEFVLYAALALFVILFGPWILVWRGSRKRKRERLESDRRWSELAGRVHALELAVKEFRESAVNPAASPLPVTQSATERPTPTPIAVPMPPGQRPARPPTAVPPPQVPTQTWVTGKSPAAEPVSPPRSASVAPPPPPSFVRPHEPRFQTVEPGPSFTERFKSALDIEEALGTNWLNKLGVIILVLGIAFFLAYQLKTFGPAGRVLVGFVVSAVMLGAGIWFERGELYRILALAGIGGGWALLFFTTYAMYHVPAAQVLSSQAT